MHAEETPQQLFERAKSGDLDAFSALVAPVRPRLLAVIHLRLPPPAKRRLEPDDVLQETLLAAVESLPTLEWQGERAFEGWLTTVARNRVRRTYQDRQCDSPLPEIEEPQSDEDATPVRLMRQEERFERLQSALAELTPSHREVVMLARIEGLRITEIASRIGKTPPATSMLLLRALRALRNAFGETESLSLPSRSLGGGGGGTRRGESNAAP
ncbi:MAG: RNA polymerase sigma factor [Planctomycetota bacterium]